MTAVTFYGGPRDGAVIEMRDPLPLTIRVARPPTLLLNAIAVPDAPEHGPTMVVYVLARHNVTGQIVYLLEHIARSQRQG